MNFSYHLIYTLATKNEQEIEWVNKCYELWVDEYSKDLASRGVTTLNRDEFQRARVIAVITSGDDVVGFHQYSTFDLREKSSREHSYIKALGEEVVKRLSDSNVNSFMALEYLTVAPEFRGRNAAGPRISEIIPRLGLKVMRELGADAAVGIARIDRKVNSTADRIGFFEIAQITKYNNPCGVVVFKRNEQELPADDFTNRLVETLWNDKQKITKIAA